MRPYIISHTMTSVDSRIDCPMVGQLSTDEYYVALAKLEPCSKLSGRVTSALECTAVKEETEPDTSNAIGRQSVHVTRRSEEYTIVVDTKGRLRWASGEADGHPVLCITSEQVSEAYLESLREQGISWIAVGKDRIVLPKAMEILHDRFGVERLAIVGGGHIMCSLPPETGKCGKMGYRHRMALLRSSALNRILTYKNATKRKQTLWKK